METAKMTAFQEVARELAGSLESARRPDGERFCRFKNDAPGWIAAAHVGHGAHVAADGADCRLPCDWIYSLIYRAALAVADCETADDAREQSAEFADGAICIYDNQLMEWTANPYNRALADDAGELFQGPNGSGYGLDAVHGGGFSGAALAWARGGQYVGAERVYMSIVEAVEAEAESR
jgi:hypothetical protein